jgi:spore maturation protein A
MLIFSIAMAIFSGKPEVVINSIIDNGKISVENILNLVGMMCFWSGIFNIFEKSNKINKISKPIFKIIDKIFDKNEINDKAKEYMSMNITTNILGVGNASTINALKAIDELQKVNKDKKKPSNNMTTFVLINTASIQLIPTSIIALRSMYGSISPSGVVVPVWIVTILSLISGLISIKILNKKME